MGNISSAVAAEEKAHEEAKHAQISVLKEALLKKVDDHQERLNAMQTSGDPHLALFKEEMLKVVDEHTQEHLKMEAEQNYLKIFKDELMQKVHEHMDELHQAQDKAQQVAKFKDELINKVDEHSKNVVTLPSM